MKQGTCSVDGCERLARYKTKKLCAKHYMDSYVRPVGNEECGHDGCGRVAHSRGLCRTHYSAWYRARNPEKEAAYRAARRTVDRGPMVGRKCRGCGESFDARAEQQVYCSTDCRGEKYRTHKVKFDCLNCGVSVTPGENGVGANAKKFCSKRCKRNWHGRHSETPRWRRPRRYEGRKVACLDCGATCIKRGRVKRCSMCQAQYEEQRKKLRRWTAGACRECGESFVGQWHPTWPPRFCSDRCMKRRERRDKRIKHGRTDTHRKRARLYGCEYETVSSRMVFERDGYMCQICGEATSAAYSFDDPWSPTIDHIVPMSKQGSHTYENIQCAHAFCNSVKNDGRSGDPAEVLGVDLASQVA